jgi:HlyD family secretion protein
MRRNLVTALAILGVFGAIAAILIDNQAQPAEEPATIPANPPYASYVAGAGLIEASTGNISIGSSVAGVATALYVRVGDFVPEGALLFQIDDRGLQAQLIAARAHVAAAEAALQQPSHQLSYSEELAERDPGAVSAQTVTDLRDRVAIAEGELGLAKAQVSQLDMEIERYTVRAPMAGRVLQLNLRTGEYVDGGTTPFLLFGDDRTLYVRIDVDESDAWRINPGAEATAFVRGNAALRIPLSFEYVEPHIVPKVSLTGRATERSDTRVLQVLYSFMRGSLPVYVGQQLDVFIAAPPVDPERAGQEAGD